MSKELTESDRQKAAAALCRWFESQDIDIADGVIIMARLIGTTVRRTAKSPAHHKSGLKILIEMMKAD